MLRRCNDYDQSACCATGVVVIVFLEQTASFKLDTNKPRTDGTTFDDGSMASANPKTMAGSARDIAHHRESDHMDDNELSTTQWPN